MRNKIVLGILLALVLCAALPLPTFGASSCTVTLSEVKDTQTGIVAQWIVTYTWTASSDGSFTAYRMPDSILDTVKGKFLWEVQTNPGTPAPTDNLDLTMTRDDGDDIMGGALADRDTANTESAMPLVASIPVPRPVINGLTLNITNNSVNGATGTVKLILVR